MNPLETQIADFFEKLGKSIEAIKNSRRDIPEEKITELLTVLRKNTATAYVTLSQTASTSREENQLHEKLIVTYCGFYDVLHKLHLEIRGGSEAVLDDPSLYKKRAETELPRIFKEFSQTNQKDTKDDKQAIQDLTNAIQNIKILPPAPTLNPVITGSQNGFKASVHEDRIAKVIAFLDENNIKHGDPQKGQAPAANEMRKESYVVVTILDETGTPKAQLFLNNYSGEAIFVVAPPLTNEDLTTMGKDGLQARNNTTRIPFDEVQGKWKITLLRAIQDIQEPNFPNIATPTDAVPKRSKAENPNGNNVIINAYLKNPQATAKALRKAFTEAFGKPASEITQEDLKRNRPVTITLPDETQVTVHSESLYREFLRQECQSLLYILQNKAALTKYSGPKIINCLRQDREATEKAIRDAVENVKDVFPTDKDNKPIITQRVIEAKDPLLTITLPRGEIVEIYMNALAQQLNKDENQDLPTLLNLLESPRAATQSENRQLIAALLDPQKRGPIIGRIKAELPTGGDLRRRDYSISFEIDGSNHWHGTTQTLYYFLNHHNKKNLKIPTLTQIRDGTYHRDDTYQETAEAAAASGTPPQAQEIDPTHTIFSTNRDR